MNKAGAGEDGKMCDYLGRRTIVCLFSVVTDAAARPRRDDSLETARMEVTICSFSLSLALFFQALLFIS